MPPTHEYTLVIKPHRAEASFVAASGTTLSYQLMEQESVYDPQAAHASTDLSLGNQSHNIPQRKNVLSASDAAAGFGHPPSSGSPNQLALGMAAIPDIPAPKYHD